MSKRKAKKAEKRTATELTAVSASRAHSWIKAMYDAAQTNRRNAAHWSQAVALSADGTMTPDVRRTLRNRSRYEVANNSYCKGLALTLAGDAIGSGPKLQLSDRKSRHIRQIEDDFEEWSHAVRLPEKLRTMRMAKVTDGEAFALLITNLSLDNDVKLDIFPIEADRIASPFLFDDSETIVDGIEIDKSGNVKRYHLLTEHPGDLKSAQSKTITVSPKDMIHWFRCDRPEQHRGIPELTAALELFANLRRYTDAVIGAAEMAARIPAVLQTDLPELISDVSANAFEEIALPGRDMMSVLPGGYKLGQLKAEQPTTTYSEFKREILGEVGRVLQVPVNVVNGDSSDHNYASGRLDFQTYHRSIRIEQDHCGRVVMSPIFDHWFMEYRNLKGMRETDMPNLRKKWFWDGFEHVDPVKESVAQMRRLINRTTSLATEYAKQGRDWEDELEQIAKERKKMLELGLIVEDKKEVK